MVSRGNRPGLGVGGHIATYASSAALYEVGFNHFFRGKDGGESGDQVFFQGHASPGIYARAFLEGRLSEDQLDGFRQELSRGGLPSYPHPRLMPDFWEFPTVSMGLGSINAIYQARFNRYLYARGSQPTPPLARVGVPRRRRDGRAGVARCDRRRRPRGAGQPHLRHQLQPAAPGRAGTWQRQDHPGAGVVLPRRRLERDQGHLGTRVGSAAREGRRRRARQPDEHHPGRPVPDLLGGDRGLHPRALLRRRRAAAPHGGAPVRRRPAPTAPRRARLPQDLLRVQGGPRARRPADGHPRQDGQGLDARAGVRGPQRDPPDEEADEGRPQDAAGPALPRHRRPGARGRPAAVLPPGPDSGRDPVHAGPAPRPGRLPALSRRPRQAADAAGRVGVRRHGQGLGQAAGRDDDGVRPAAQGPDAGQGDRQAIRADHPGRGAHVRNGLALPDREDLLAARAERTTQSTGSCCCRTRRRPTARSCTRASARPVRWAR